MLYLLLLLPIEWSMVVLRSLLLVFLAALLLPQTFSAKSSKKSQNVVITASSGVGVFQDIQVPINPSAGRRGDGRTTETEFKDHLGFPLQASLGFRRTVPRWLYELDLRVLQMGAASGPAETQSSSYSRTDLTAAAHWRFRTGRNDGFLGAKLKGRKSSFNNVSSGHYIDSAIIGLSLGIERTESWRFGVELGYAPYAQFGYSPGRAWNGSKFKNSSTQLMEVAVLSSFRLTDQAWFDLGIQRETAAVQITDVNEYDTFGLSVAPAIQRNRNYDLATTILKVGVRKEF